MITGIQKKLKSMGESACYELSLMYLAEKAMNLKVNVMNDHEALLDLGFIDEDCMVKDASSAFRFLAASKKWVVLKAGPGHELPFDYDLRPGEYEVIRFERPGEPGKDPIAHFVVGAGDGVTVEWDPWPDSLTVKVGYPVSRRIIRPM